MKMFRKTLLPFALSVMSTGAAVAQVDNDAAKAAKSAADAASSAASADASKKAAEAAAAKFELPIDIAVGDRIKVRSKVTGLTTVNSAADTTIPIYTCLRVVRLGANGGLTVTVEDDGRLLRGACRDLDDGQVKVGDTFTMTADQVRNTSYSRYGWIYGPMIVPFKYFPHDRSFEPSQSLGMYMGYRTSWFESRGLSFVGSAGVATMKVSQVVDDPAKPGSKTTKENTIAGYTVAGGVLFDLTREAKPFVAGLLVGRDFVGRNSALEYKHDNKTWIALQLGWAQ